MKIFSVRKLVSLISLYSFLICAFTGIILYIVPPTRVANAIKWTMVGWGRADYVKFHTIFSLILLIVIILHIYYNISAVKQYLKLKWEGTHLLKSESLVAIVIIVLIFIGTHYNVAPFEKIMKWGAGAKASWEKNAGTIPINSKGQPTDHIR